MRRRGALGAYLRRQRARLGAPKASTAAAHQRARLVYHRMRYGEGYVQQTEQEYAEQVQVRLEKALHRRAKELGDELKKVEPALEEVVMPDGEVRKETPAGVIVETGDPNPGPETTVLIRPNDR